MRAIYRPARRPSVLYAVVRGDVRAEEFGDELARIEAKRPRRVVLDLSDTTSVEAGAIRALLGLERRLAADGALVQVIAGSRFAAELAALGAAHLIDEDPATRAGSRLPSRETTAPRPQVPRRDHEETEPNDPETR